MKKTVLILVDGMRPDAVMASGHPFVKELMSHGAHCLRTQTVMPSVTLPCHMSLFHSVEPDRHGITTNTYVPQVRPVRGLCENLRLRNRKCAFFYNWEELKDLSRPDSLCYANYVSGHIFGYEESNRILTDNAISFITANRPDFTFLYLGWTDEAGHAKGWMGEEYMRSVYESLSCIQDVAKALPEEYLLIVTADHGGHDRCHGTDMPEDMTTPLFLYAPDLPAKELEKASILDIAPTVARLLGSENEPEWEGECIEI